MSTVTPTQTNFNAGEISRRLHGRFDLAIYGIALAEVTGWGPLVEGPLDAAPGLLRVEAARGPCRLVPFEPYVTQGHVVEMSEGIARFYTNDARIEAEGVPMELALPYTLSEIWQASWFQSYDVLYLFHGLHQTRQLVRTGAESFTLEPLELSNGPWETRNADETILVKANGTTGDVALEATQDGDPYPLFAPGDVGGIFMMEAIDVGDVPLWEPGITVTTNQLLASENRVYAVVGGLSEGEGRTGRYAPTHVDGVQWDGIGSGTDVNDDAAGGVQLAYIHDLIGIVRLTGYVDSAHMNATVLKRIPSSLVNAGA